MSFPPHSFKLRLLSLPQPMLVLPPSWWHQSVIPCEISRWGGNTEANVWLRLHSRKEKHTVEVYLELCAWLEEAFEELDLNGKVPSTERTWWRAWRKMLLSSQTKQVGVPTRQIVEAFEIDIGFYACLQGGQNQWFAGQDVFLFCLDKWNMYTYHMTPQQIYGSDGTTSSENHSPLQGATCHFSSWLPLHRFCRVLNENGNIVDISLS